ncbi:MAG: polysaccharide export protein [Lachnospiraceae bacterium]|nr:polysaccharide export protein [Lachnospiraceae bacterium]
MNTNNTPYENDEIEIDLLELFMALKRRFWLILAITVLGGGIAGAFSKFVLTPQYTSTAMVYILSKETTLTSLADLQIGSQLTKDYAVIVTSRPVLEDVLEKQGLDLTYEDLKEKITINNPKDTRILSISVQDPDPKMAKALADEVASTASSYIGDIMEMVPPKMIEDGQVPIKKTSPSNFKNAVIGAMAGFAAVCGLIVLEVLMNDTVRTEEDVEKYLGLTVLAMVPAREGEKEEDKEALAKNKPVNKTKGRKRGKRG